METLRAYPLTALGEPLHEKRAHHSVEAESGTSVGLAERRKTQMVRAFYL